MYLYFCIKIPLILKINYWIRTLQKKIVYPDALKNRYFVGKNNSSWIYQWNKSIAIFNVIKFPDVSWKRSTLTDNLRCFFFTFLMENENSTTNLAMPQGKVITIRTSVNSSENKHQWITDQYNNFLFLFFSDEFSADFQWNYFQLSHWHFYL